MKITIILGTRPEIIKMSPIIRECENRKTDYFILHTGQHYSYNMDKVFFEQLDLPKPKYNLDIGSGTHAEQTGKMLIGIEKILLEEKPDLVLVEGDTNSVMAGALAASKLGIKIGHVESGLRSYDRSMPEEINRILTDHCSDYLFAPTENSRQILLREGIDKDKIFVTGNTIVDAIYQNLKFSKRDVYNSLEIEKNGYIIGTVHRQENVDSLKRFQGILDGMSHISKEFSMPIIFPIHGRSMKMMKNFGLSVDKNIRFIEPLDYFNFLFLENNAKMILTDSGGIQEEACIIGVPCITLRDNTERPETIDVKSNILSGTDPLRILECAKIMFYSNNHWPNPFGDGKAGERIINIISDKNFQAQCY